MKTTLFKFQENAAGRLRQLVSTAIREYQDMATPQIISFAAPTGAGKTIIMSSLIEQVYCGDGIFPDQPDAIFLWISDNPELNVQSKIKLETKTDKLQFGQFQIIDAASFDREKFEDGVVYFINTQKLSVSSNLSKHSDGRQYTIWETLANTVADKANRFYVIIDEAHRGMLSKKENADAQTTMQKFLLGSKKDKIPAMPIVIGMSATVERFNTFASGATSSTTRRVVVSADEVRSSGLLKDLINIRYPEEFDAGSDISILQAATDEWLDKCAHWDQYCYEQHYTQVRPVFIIQVLAGSGSKLTESNLGEILTHIEERVGKKFEPGEVVHTFGQTTSAVDANGYMITYCEPSRIADDRKIKVVFFKENLSTGWDCPRAETLLSYRKAEDATYIAQLLGRMIRTPLQCHVDVDETLNNVHLFLPHFNRDKVDTIVSELQAAEGGEIATEITSEAVGSGDRVVMTVRKTRPVVHNHVQPSFTAPAPVSNGITPAPAATPAPSPETAARPVESVAPEQTSQRPAPETPVRQEQTAPASSGSATGEAPELILSNTPADADYVTNYDDGIDREGVVRYINNLGLETYKIRKIQTSNYLRSLYDLTRLLSATGLWREATDAIRTDIAKLISEYAQGLRDTGKYDELASNISQFVLLNKTIDAFGNEIQLENGLVADKVDLAASDIDRKFAVAERQLGCEGIGNLYLRLYADPDDLTSGKIDVILFAGSEDCMDKLHKYAKPMYHEVNEKYRRATIKLTDYWRKQYNQIVSNGDMVSSTNFILPTDIDINQDKEGKMYSNHLYVDPAIKGAKYKLNAWEESVIALESNRDDFVTWLRNGSKAKYALCLPYNDVNNVPTAMYPDFLVIRKDDVTGFVVDILEPHRDDLDDNLGKARGLAEYARKNQDVIGRVALIRKVGDKMKYLNVARSDIRDEVLRITTQGELNNLFDRFAE